jgi:uncharacterized protein YhfF
VAAVVAGSCVRGFGVLCPSGGAWQDGRMSDDVTSGETRGNPPHLDDAVQADRILWFWDVARVRAGRTSLGGAIGESAATMVPPQAWAFGDSPRLAHDLLRLVLAGVKTATASLLWEYQDAEEPIPAKGDLSIVLDGAGEPRALIRTTAVEVVPFGEVTEEHAYLEGEDDRTLATWREQHERYWQRNSPEGRELTPSTQVVCERFKVLYP